MRDFEMVELLKDIAGVDPRFALPPDRAARIAAFWFGTVGHLDAGDAWDAVMAYYGAPTERRIMPGDVAEGVRDIRVARALKIPGPEVLMRGVTDPEPGSPAWEAIYRERRRQAMERPRPGPLALPPA